MLDRSLIWFENPVPPKRYALACLILSSCRYLLDIPCRELPILFLLRYPLAAQLTGPWVITWAELKMSHRFTNGTVKLRQHKLQPPRPRCLLEIGHLHTIIYTTWSLCGGILFSSSSEYKSRGWDLEFYRLGSRYFTNYSSARMCLKLNLWSYIYINHVANPSIYQWYLPRLPYSGLYVIR